MFKPNTDYYRPDGTYLFTTNSAGIVTTNIANPIFFPVSYYWTRLASDWTMSSNCDGWSSTNYLDSGIEGISDSTNSNWYSSTSSPPSCDTNNFLLCVEQ